MLKDRKLLEGKIEQEINAISVDKEKIVSICEYANNKHNIPMDMICDYMTARISLAAASDFIIYCILESLIYCTGSKIEIDKYFLENEIKTYSKALYQMENLGFPLKFKMIQISPDQWIGHIDIQTMMKLRNAQLINYNVNTQRAMQRIIKGDTEYYKIRLNQTAVNAIMRMYKEDQYIPTPFTLNILAEEPCSYYYDKEEGELVIEDIKHFDILDGYHRYIAACKLWDIDSEFNYDMELRIVNFGEDKAKQFIYQEDQKTKMAKVDSNSLNMNDSGNIVAERLNNSSKCNFKGLISRNEGLISLGELAGLINYFYFNGSKKEKEQILIINVVKELCDKFNSLAEYDLKYLKMKYSFKDLCAIMYVFNNYNGDDFNDMCMIIDNILTEVEKLDNKKFYLKKPKKTIMNDISRILKEGGFEGCITEK